MDPSSVILQQQEMGMNGSLENMMMVCPKAQQQDKKPKPPPHEQALKCPRCDSANTKFCYYNNYSLTQPRYFCKGCRRYWTKGGTLRNVPVGGGCRKNKRSSSKRGISQEHHHDQSLMIMTSPNPNPLSNNLPYDCNDLSLAFSRLQKQSSIGNHDHQLSILGNLNNTHFDIFGNSNSTPNHGFLDTFRANIFQENPINGGLQNVYCGGGFGNNGKIVGDEVENSYDQTIAQYDEDQTSDSNVKHDSNKVLWGYPWQIGGTYESHINDLEHDHRLDLGRESWNINSTPIAPLWHGLLNSPLM